MDVLDLKEYILENDYIGDILESIGCHSIKHHSGNPDDYYTCANPDGDNTTAINVYENEYLLCANYTRNIIGKNGVAPDIFRLVEYIMGYSFFESFKHICGVVGLDVYYNFKKDIPKSLLLTNMIDKMNRGEDDSEETKITIRSERILSYYKPYVNDLFFNDGIGYNTQRIFEIGYDEMTNRITIPIRTEFGDLAGVKGRIFEEDYDGDFKYVYLERCPRNQILYGLNKTIGYIESDGSVFVTESEKGVMQLWEMGHYNAVGIGGKLISRNQIVKLERLNAKIILVFDKDVSEEELLSISKRFAKEIPVYAIIDVSGILDEHESPTDNKDKWNYLYENNMYLIKEGRTK